MKACNGGAAIVCVRSEADIRPETARADSTIDQYGLLCTDRLGLRDNPLRGATAPHTKKAEMRVCNWTPSSSNLRLNSANLSGDLGCKSLALKNDVRKLKKRTAIRRLKARPGVLEIKRAAMQLARVDICVDVASFRLTQSFKCDFTNWDACR